MRAPPDAETETSGTPASAARSHARANFSPTTLPIEPPMNAKSMTASSHACALDLAAHRTRSRRRAPSRSRPRRAARCTGGGRRTRAGRPSEARRRSSTNAPGSTSCSIRSRAPTRKWWPHCGHTRSACCELVVAVVRAAARAGVRVRLPLSGLVRALALDLDVDASLPGRHALDLVRGLRNRPPEHPRRQRGVPLGRRGSPVTPIPAIVVRPAMSARSRFDPSRGGPSGSGMRTSTSLGSSTSRSSAT